MEDDNKELPELKTLYDELWSDARTMVKDMTKSISIYLYAGIVTLLVSAFAITAAVSYLYALFSGASNLAIWFFSIMETVSAVVTVAFGAKLLSWYRRLKKKYSKLIQREKTLSD